MRLPALRPELTLSRSIMPPLACAVAVPAFPAAALPPLPPAPPAPPVAVLVLPPLALVVAVPPSALRSRVVRLLTWPPLTAMLAGGEQLVAEAAGASDPRPSSMAATGTRRSPASSTERCCRMNRAAPVVRVWVVMSLSCPLLANCSAGPAACCVVEVMSGLLACGARSVGSGSLPVLHPLHQARRGDAAPPSP